MILSSVAIAGGALTASVKVYRDHKRKKEYPWTVAAERMAVYPLLKRKRENRYVATGKAALNEFTKQQKILFLPDTRQEKLAELSSGSEEAAISVEEQEVNRLLAVSASSLVITTASLWVPALKLLLVPTTIYLLVPFLKRAKKLIFEEKHLGVPMVDLIFVTGALAKGHYFAFNLVYGFVYLSEKLTIKTEDHSMSDLVNIFGEPPRFIWVLVDGVEVEIPFESVKAGDTVVIQAGQTIAVDGMIADGYATIDQRTLTGESQPVEKGPGEQVFASTVVLSGKVYVQVDCEAPCGKSGLGYGCHSNR